MIGGARIDRARQLLVAGDVNSARMACDASLAAPADANEAAGAHLILAACCRREGNVAAMVAHAVAATAAAPRDAMVHYALAECVEEAGDKRRAIGELQRAIDLNPQLVQAHRYLGVLLADVGEFETATECFKRALSLDPKHPEAWNNLGNALRALGRLADAEAAYLRALALKPAYPRAECNLALLQRDQGRADLAEATLRACLAREPPAAPFRPALNALAGILRQRGALDEAAELYLRSARMVPDDSAAEMLNLGNVLTERNDPVQARKAFAHALRLRPRNLRAALALHLTLPMIYESATGVLEARAAFEQGLVALERDVDAIVGQSSWEEVADGLQWSNFFLAYQGEDDKALQARYAALAARALDRAGPEWRSPMAGKAVSGRRIRIGFASSFLKAGTVGQYFARWITDLDPASFEVYFYHLRAGDDEVTVEIGERADAFRMFAGADARPAKIAPAIRADRLDLLLYPELGMDQTAFALAAMRLAPRQYCAWGHPVTTGHPTIDGYFSCAAMEPADGESHYTEKLIRLLGIGTRFRRPTLPEPIEREAYSLPRDATLLLCPQSLFKIHPDNDALFARVLIANPKAVMVLFAGRHPAITDQFMRRLARCFEQHGLPIRERTRVLPQLPHEEYLAVSLACDAMLDTMRWSGGQTSVDALNCGLPIVTLPGSMMRGRQSAGMLSLLDLHELIAADADDYARIATRLCQDVAWRAGLAERIRERNGRLFDDPAPLDALEVFYREAASVAVS
jgi:protein O-GlcNAc transferase